MVLIPKELTPQTLHKAKIYVHLLARTQKPQDEANEDRRLIAQRSP